MKRCLNGRDDLARMGEEGYRKVISQHGESTFAKTVNDFLDQHAAKNK
jgi:hypothetical protein